MEPIRVLDLAGSPAEMGARHGAAHAEEIREFAADRISLTAEEMGLSRDEILDLARDCLPAHEEYAPGLYAEMEALAGAARITPAEAMILGGYTDFLDTVKAHAGGGPSEDNCTAALVPEAVADGSGYLAQTWDMHISATQHVVMLRMAPSDSPAALVYSTVGCLGQIGINSSGIAVGINNLSADDGRIGVTWPFVVRKVLLQTNLDAAIECVLEADLAGGHNYLLLDGSGRGVDIEAMPSRHVVTELADEPLIHTNHCLLPETVSVEANRPADLQASSVARLGDAVRHLERRPVTLDSLIDLTRDEASICRPPTTGDGYQTCGAVIMRPATLEMWACWGVPSETEYERFALEGVPA